MGACDFYAKAKGKTAKDAFNQAVSDAQYEHGHGGYTGTIAEKRSFKMVTLPAGKTLDAFVEECMDNHTHFCRDKWGDAACVALGNDEFYFFGMASS